MKLCIYYVYQEWIMSYYLFILRWWPIGKFNAPPPPPPPPIYGPGSPVKTKPCWPVWSAEGVSCCSKNPRQPKCITNRSPTNDNLQKTILRPLTAKCRTKIVRGCKKAGVWSLCDHANTGSMLLLCICNISYIFIMFLENLSYLVYCQSETGRQPVRERSPII